MKYRFILYCALLNLVSCSPDSPPATALNTLEKTAYSQDQLKMLVERVRQQYDLPALGVLVQNVASSPLIAVAGIRKMGGDTPVEAQDMWFIGSTAKAMTATLMATFVQSGTVGFDTRLVDLFPEYSSSFTREARLITIEHLLSHSSGLQANPAKNLDELNSLTGETDDVLEQKKRILEKVVSKSLLFEPGTGYSYSNTGYIIAGAVIERLGGREYESLLVERVFAPLNILRFGFGHPADGRHIPAQPWGHRATLFGFRRVAVNPEETDFVNPPVFNPAGNLYIDIRDWGTFVQDALNGSAGQGKLLDQSLYERLQMPKDKASGYSMGWGVLVEDGEAILLTHNGSDGNWFADVRAFPYSKLILLTVTNDGREDGEAKDAAAQIRRDFFKHYSAYPAE